MHRSFSRPNRSLAPMLLALAVVTGVAHAQLGPNAAEIPAETVPATRAEPTPESPVREEDPIREPGPAEREPAAEPAPAQPRDPQAQSSSALARPAIDEMLIATARRQTGATTPAQASEDDTTPTPAAEDRVREDLRASNESIPIGVPQTRTALIGAADAEQNAVSLGDGWAQTILALSGVILLILGLGQLYKRLAKSQGGLVGQLGAGGSAPSGILEVIGRYPISKGMTLVVMKFDRRVLLVAHGAPSRGKFGRNATMQTLCELTDAEDVASVLLKARSASGESIAQSFERALQEADDLTDESMHDYEPRYAQPVRFPSPRRGEPARTITTDEGDRAELWSSGQNSSAASGVLRKRLSSMRRGQQG